MFFNTRRRNCLKRLELWVLTRTAPCIWPKATAKGTTSAAGNYARRVAEGQRPRDYGDRGKQRFGVARATLIDLEVFL